MPTSSKLCLIILSILALSSSILCAGKATLYYNCGYNSCNNVPSWSYTTVKLDGKVHYLKLGCNGKVVCFIGTYTDNSQNLYLYSTDTIQGYAPGSNPCFEAEAYGLREPAIKQFNITNSQGELCINFPFVDNNFVTYYFDGKAKETSFDILGFILTIIAVIVVICAFFCLICCAFFWVIVGLYCAGFCTGVCDGISKKIQKIRKNRKEKRRELMERRKQEEENRKIMEGLKNLKEEKSDDEKDD